MTTVYPQSTTWYQLSMEERDQLLLHYRERRENTKFLEDATRLRMRPDTLRRRLNEHLQEKRRYAAEYLRLSPIKRPRYDDHLILKTDNAIIISDLEIPDVDDQMMRKALLVAIRHDIKTLIIAGDFLATDQAALKEQIDLYKEDGELTYRSALMQGKITLKALLLWFEEIVLIRGNHDDKLNRATKGEIDVGMFLEDSRMLEGKVRFSQYAHCYLETSRGTALICHPRQYSVNPVALGKKLYNTHALPDKTKPSFVILGHTHISQSGESEDGLAEIYGLGCMRDPLKTQYIALNVTTFPKWNQGFGFFKNGYFHNLSLHRTDWRFYLGTLQETS